MRHTAMIGLLLGGVVLLAPTQGQASHEPFGVYETWSNPTIRSDRWRGGEIFGGQEVQRVVEIGAISNDLLMSLRREGETSSNTGVNFSSNLLNATNPLAVDQMEATFQVVSLTVTGCAANPAVSRARAARLLLARFNDGSSATPGDRTGDHFAGIQVQRSSDSSDPDGVLTVVGFLARCGDPGCFAGLVTTVSFVVLPQTATVGINSRLRIIWDSPNNQFLFGVDDNPNVPLGYNPGINVQPARVPFAQISVGPETANCMAGPTVAETTTQVFIVNTNTSAIIP